MIPRVGHRGSQESWYVRRHSYPAPIRVPFTRRAPGKVDVVIRRGVPRSTAYGWLTRSHTDVITLDVLESDVTDLQREVVSLRCRNARLTALLRLVVTVLKVTGFSLSRIRLPRETSKLQVLRAIEQSRHHFALRTVLPVIGLTHGRFHAWTTEEYRLDDVLS